MSNAWLLTCKPCNLQIQHVHVHVSLFEIDLSFKDYMHLNVQLEKSKKIQCGLF